MVQLCFPSPEQHRSFNPKWLNLLSHLIESDKRQRLRGLSGKDGDENGAVATSKEAAAMAGKRQCQVVFTVEKCCHYSLTKTYKLYTVVTLDLQKPIS